MTSLFPIQTDSTVVIDDKYGFYASEVEVEQPYKEWNVEHLEIDMGPPRSFETNQILRKMKFKHTANQMNITVVRDALEPLNKGIHDFSSTYLGAFKARIKVRLRYEERTPDVTIIEFEVTEEEI